MMRGVSPLLLTALCAPSSAALTASFAELGLNSQLVNAAAQQAWQTPTKVQSTAIPAILAKKNVWAEAPTGSGKTAAFVLPLLQRLLDDGPQRRGRNGIRVLILSPTRELVVQTAETFHALATSRGPKVVALHGGVSINPQLRSLGGGADIVVSTPGRLLDILDSNGASVGGVSALLLDEADRLLAPQFQSELEEIVSRLPAASARQTLLFSATFPFRSRPRAKALLPPEFERLVSGAETDEEADNAIMVDTSVDGGDGGDGSSPAAAAAATRGDDLLERDSTAARYASAAPPATISQRAISVDLRERTPLLRHLLETEGWASVLVFVGSQKASEHVAAKLVAKGYRASALHGGLSQEVRTDRLEELRSGRLRVLVATDLAARGLDVHGLPAIVNYDLPRSTADYTHRVGRTGRAGASGVAVSFIASTGAGNEAHFGLIERRHGGMCVPREVIAGFEPKDIDRLATPAAAGEQRAAAAEGSGAEEAAERVPVVPGVRHSRLGLAHDRMHGGVKGRRMSKKDKLRAEAARRAREEQAS